MDNTSGDGGLKELVLRWFTETQAPLILHHGNFPDWFRGFAARKDAEDLLRDKGLGCFLLRLSDKAIGYILSYKGLDRCRHFVIKQNQDGHFAISGDSETYQSLPELIQHYKVSPIQPFGEHLTSSYCEESADELYDVVNQRDPRVTPGVSVQVLRSLWDKKNPLRTDASASQNSQQQNTGTTTTQLPALPPKSRSRKLTGTVSMGVPPVPKRGLPLGLSLSGSSLPERDTSSHPRETPSSSIRSERARGNATDTDSFTCDKGTSPGDLGPPGTTYSDLKHLESKCLPRQLDEEDEKYGNLSQLSSPSFTPAGAHSPSHLKKVTCQTYSLHEPRAPRPGDDLVRTNPLYLTSGPVDNMYAEVPGRPTPTANMYEQIPEKVAGVAGVAQVNMYESLDDMKSKKSKSTLGKSNMKWKKFLPDYMKK